MCHARAPIFREVSYGVEGATFEENERDFDLLAVRITLAVKDSEKVAYITCKIAKSRRSVVATLRLSSNHNSNNLSLVLTARLILEKDKGKLITH